MYTVYVPIVFFANIQGLDQGAGIQDCHPDFSEIVKPIWTLHQLEFIFRPGILLLPVGIALVMVAMCYFYVGIICWLILLTVKNFMLLANVNLSLYTLKIL